MVICNYRFGSNVCLDECHKTDGGRVTSKCKKHLNQAAKKSRKKLIRKIEFTSPRDALIAKATENSEAKKRTQRSRAGRQDAIETIQNDNVRRIATILHYSALISLEENTTLLVGKGRKTASIPLHSMIFFRGDMTHAGAGYTEENSRLFISVSSAAFPATEDVSLVN